MRRRLGTVAVALAALTICASAQASWNANGPNARAYSKSRSLPAGLQPNVSVSGRNVTVNWAAPSGGAPVSGYVVKRYDGSGNTQAIGAACAGVVATTSCTENAVPAGSWRYTVTPANANWRGAESPQSPAVVVSAPSLNLSQATVATLPATLSGQIASFVSGQTVTFRLDNPSSGTMLTGSITPSPVPASGTATVSVTVPAATAPGSHTLYAVGSGSDVASANITVLTPRTVSSTAWDLRDASAGGSAANASDQIAFASDGRTIAPNAPPLTFNTSRYLQLDYDAPLPTNATPSSASFDFRFAAASLLSTACFYFDVRRASTNAVIGTHGSTSNPAGCVTGTTQTSFSIALPEVTSGAIANDLRVRVYMRDSLLGAPVLDQSTVAVASSQGAFTLYDNDFSDLLSGTATSRTWPLVANGGTTYTSASTWATAFASSRYLRLAFPSYVPSGASVTGATFSHGYRPSGGGTVCWYFEVLQGSTVLGTHGSAGSPVSCATTGYVNDTVALPEINSPARANGAVVKIYMRNSSSQRSQTDAATLSVNYSN